MAVDSEVDAAARPAFREAGVTAFVDSGRAWWDTVRDRRPWVRAAAAATNVWLVTHAMYLAVTVLATLPAPSDLGQHYPHASFSRAFHLWFKWDGAWYLSIARNGYSTDRATAFFPLYPLLSRAADFVLPGGIFFASAVVASASMWAGLAMLYRFVESETSTEVARRTLWLLVAFPTAFFLSGPYPNGLILLLMAGSLYQARKNNWWIAGALGGLAAACRSAGLLLVVPLAYEYLRQRGFSLGKIRLDLASFLLVPLGVVAFMAYTQATRHDAFAFVHAQHYWNRELSGPWISLAESVKVAVTSRLIQDPINALELGSVLFALTALVLAVVGPWRMRRDQLAVPLLGFALLAFILVFPSSRYPNEPLLSASRHTLEMFPVFMALGRVCSRPPVQRAYLVIGSGVQCVLLVHYLHGGWVA